jgi:energy-coupling factor transport system substrate-specific component
MHPEDVQALVTAIELKDQSTAAHTWRVIFYTRAMAEALGVSADELERVTTAAALHDVGKIDIPDEILQKPGKLTDEEFEVIKSHSARGHARLVALGVDDPIILNFVRHHHERWDGLGYPDRLAGDAIPVGPRFFGVIDTFDALTSIRPYRREIGPEAARKAIEELRSCAGTRYWADAVEAFAGMYERGGLDWILSYFNDEAQLPGLEAMGQFERMTREGRG